MRSMRFGIILLLLIAAVSVVGSLIPQGNEPAYYAKIYGSGHPWILLLGLDNVFKGWVFIALTVLLSLNLTLCSVVRIRKTVSEGKDLLENVSRLPDAGSVTPEEIGKIKQHLKSKRCREKQFDWGTVYYKNLLGRYGTFITHLAILLTVVFGALALSLPTVTDQTCYPGNSITMKDGTEIYVDSFSIEDEEGNLNYNSFVQLTLSDGRQSGLQQIKVNYPLSFRGYKVYQQTYGTAGSVEVVNARTGGQDVFILEESAFLSTDGLNGIFYRDLYPGFVKDGNGNYTLITSTSGSYPDPVYDIAIMSEGEQTDVLAFPGDEITLGDFKYVFNDPVEYPGLRIKHTPNLVNVLLLISFVLLTAGLYMTFFTVPSLVKVSGTGYAVAGPKPEADRIEIEMILKNGETNL